MGGTIAGARPADGNMTVRADATDYRLKASIPPEARSFSRHIVIMRPITAYIFSPTPTCPVIPSAGDVKALSRYLALPECHRCEPPRHNLWTITSVFIPERPRLKRHPTRTHRPNLIFSPIHFPQLLSSRNPRQSHLVPGDGRASVDVST